MRWSLLLPILMLWVLILVGMGGMDDFMNFDMPTASMPPPYSLPQPRGG